MPTAAKLFSAVAFAAFGWLAIQILSAHLAPGARLGTMNSLVLIVGATAGWMMMGREVGHGWYRAGATGLRTSVVISLVVLFVVSFGDMIKRSMQGLYNGPVDALQDVFDLMLRHGQVILNLDVIAVIAIGGIVSGLVAEWASRNWR